VDFAQYKATLDKASNKYTILDLPIFKLGKHKGFPYTKDWAEKTIKNHEGLAKDGYLPSVILGHNDGKGEKPSKGLLKNFRLKNDTIHVDIANIAPKTLETLKDGEFPHRSVEVNPKAGRFTALALLGGTTPYHKLPVMELFGENDQTEVIEFAHVDIAGEVEIKKQWRMLTDAFEAIRSAMSSMLWDKNLSTNERKKNMKQAALSGADVIKKEASNFEEKAMNEPNVANVIAELDQQFKKQHGLTPQEAIERVNKMEAEQKANLLSTREAAIKAFAEEAKKDGLSPALLDEAILPLFKDIPETEKFAEGHAYADKLLSAVKAIFKAAKEDKLLIPMEEQTEHGSDVSPASFDDSDGNPDRAKLDKKIQDYATKHNVSYEEASEKVVV